MENRAHALSAGLFLLLLGIAAAAALWWLSGKREFTRDYVLVSTGNVTGLNPESRVNYRGMRAGKVIDIDLDPQDRRNLLVTIRIDASLPLTRSTRAQLNVQGVTGLAYVQLTDTGESDEPLEAADGALPRIALEPSQLEQLSQGAVELLAQVRTMAGRINAALDERNLAHLARILARLESASAGIDESARELPALVASARRVLAQADFGRLGAVLANLERASGEAVPAVAEVRATVAGMQSLVARLDGLSRAAGDEVLGDTLPRANALLRELSASARALHRLVDGIEADPQAVLFGRQAGRAGPGEAGFEAPRR